MLTSDTKSRVIMSVSVQTGRHQHHYITSHVIASSPAQLQQQCVRPTHCPLVLHVNTISIRSFVSFHTLTDDWCYTNANYIYTTVGLFIVLFVCTGLVLRINYSSNQSGWPAPMEARLCITFVYNMSNIFMSPLWQRGVTERALYSNLFHLAK